jgi:hypothetical protein
VGLPHPSILACAASSRPPVVVLELQWCYRTVTVVLQWGCGGVAVVSQWCHTASELIEAVTHACAGDTRDRAAASLALLGGGICFTHHVLRVCVCVCVHECVSVCMCVRTSVCSHVRAHCFLTCWRVGSGMGGVEVVVIDFAKPVLRRLLPQHTYTEQQGVCMCGLVLTHGSIHTEQ